MLRSRPFLVLNLWTKVVCYLKRQRVRAWRQSHRWRLQWLKKENKLLKLVFDVRHVVFPSSFQIIRALICINKKIGYYFYFLFQILLLLHSTVVCIQFNNRKRNGSSSTTRSCPYSAQSKWASHCINDNQNEPRMSTYSSQRVREWSHNHLEFKCRVSWDIDWMPIK